MDTINSSFAVIMSFLTLPILDIILSLCAVVVPFFTFAITYSCERPWKRHIAIICFLFLIIQLIPSLLSSIFNTSNDSAADDAKFIAGMMIGFAFCGFSSLFERIAMIGDIIGGIIILSFATALNRRIDAAAATCTMWLLNISYSLAGKQWPLSKRVNDLIDRILALLRFAPANNGRTTTPSIELGQTGTNPANNGRTTPSLELAIGGAAGTGNQNQNIRLADAGLRRTEFKGFLQIFEFPAMNEFEKELAKELAKQRDELKDEFKKELAKELAKQRDELKDEFKKELAKELAKQRDEFEKELAKQRDEFEKELAKQNDEINGLKMENEKLRQKIDELESKGKEKRPRSTWELGFKQPASDNVKFHETLDSQKVALENVMLKNEQGRMNGTIKVVNIAYEKVVGIRFTADQWQTQTDELAHYQPSSSATNFDTFRFDIDIPRNETKDSRLEFCIYYLVKSNNGWQEYWDSNGQRNFSLLSSAESEASPSSSISAQKPTAEMEMKLN